MTPSRLALYATALSAGFVVTHDSRWGFTAHTREHPRARVALGHDENVALCRLVAMVALDAANVGMA